MCESPAPEVGNYHFGATLTDDTLTGATLWADFQRGNPMLEEACSVGMNDFRQIKRNTPARVKTRHREPFAFLESDIQPGGIVMTHFAPSWQSIPPNYGSSELNGYYVSDLEDLILRKRPALWLHGYIHSGSDYRIGDPRMICNPESYEGTDHDPYLRIELP